MGIVNPLQLVFGRMIDRRIAEYQNDLITKHCEEVQNIYKTMRDWRHDYHNHIQTLLALSGDEEKTREYLLHLNDDLTCVDTVIKTGNVMVDAILNSKLSLIKSKHIRMNAKAVVPPALQISEIDLCVIIGNLLDNAVEACLEKAGMADGRSGMPEGMETCLYKDFEESGVEISGGEAQKIALARALYKDAPFIILDEPTAALDPVAEYEVYTKFNEIVGNKTAVYISHRLSSCRFCDKIIVFDEGKIIQQGSHEALVLDEGGRYHELWHAQAQYYA